MFFVNAYGNTLAARQNGFNSLESLVVLTVDSLFVLRSELLPLDRHYDKSAMHFFPQDLFCAFVKPREHITAILKKVLKHFPAFLKPCFFCPEYSEFKDLI